MKQIPYREPANIRNHPGGGLPEWPWAKDLCMMF